MEGLSSDTQFTCRSCGAPVIQERLHLPDHPFPSLLATNDVPSAVAIPRVRQDIHDTEATLSVVESEMARLQHILTRLASEQKMLQRCLNANRGLVSSLRRLPNELLSQIFIACLPKDVATIHAVVLRLGSVCRLWWDIAISTPDLWTSAYIGYSTSSKSRAWLQRAGKMPLSLTVKVPGIIDTSAIVDLIVSYASRWNHLDLWIKDIFSNLNTALTEGFPALRSLSLALYSGAVLTSTKFPFAPQLRRVSFSNKGGFVISPPDLPWSQLTHLALCEFVESESLQILSQASNSIECDLQDLFSWSSDSNGRLCVALPCLRSLHISCQHSLFFIERLTLPALEDLEFRSSIQHLAIPQGPRSFLSFLLRSQCPLTRLSLNLACVDEDELIQSLPYLSSLRGLNISDGFPLDASSAIFRAKVIPALDRNNIAEGSPSGYRDCLPELRVLSLRNFWVDTQALARMIRSRWRGPDNSPHSDTVFAQLERAQFGHDGLKPPISDTELEPLRALKRDGFAIDLGEYLPMEF
ncbi:hypothetical protein PLICRDRAFT_54522 [Plicaturopsis crispa FD-325 SS-3]|nr:hypothetical protein PLICRDRAFT_54522 [Plicaturopsis crispa FD-325 SS-3]